MYDLPEDLDPFFCRPHSGACFHFLFPRVALRSTRGFILAAPFGGLMLLAEWNSYPTSSERPLNEAFELVRDHVVEHEVDVLDLHHLVVGER